MRLKSIFSILLPSALVLTMLGCAEKNPVDDEHDDVFDITYSYSPTPATAGTSITFTFEVESEGTHVSGLTETAVEFEMTGMAPVEMDLTEGESGHYTGSTTFSMAGVFEVHFHYTHDGEASHAEMATDLTIN